MNKIEIRYIGEVGVDSGQLIICDPCYLENQFIREGEVEGEGNDFAHTIYQHKDGSKWQFTYGAKTSYPDVKPFPGSYEEIIPEYGKKPNELIKEGTFVALDLDKTPHIPKGEFSYRGICKETLSNAQGGQLNYKMGHPGAAVAFSSGFGDGVYPVHAEFTEGRVRKVWVEFFKTENEESLNDHISTILQALEIYQGDYTKEGDEEDTRLNKAIDFLQLLDLTSVKLSSNGNY